VNKDLLYLESIRECLERVAEYTAAGEQAFLESRLVQDGVIRNLEVIGEATKNLSTDLRTANPEIPWRQKFPRRRRAPPDRHRPADIRQAR
jgi:uncharacterized protein with HEPN domain